MQNRRIEGILSAVRDGIFERDSNVWETLCRSAKVRIPAPQVRNRDSAWRTVTMGWVVQPSERSLSTKDICLAVDM
jgi:hypothetical protein